MHDVYVSMAISHSVYHVTTRLATNLATFGKTLATFQISPDLELYLSLCLIWSVSAGSGWEEQHIPVTAQQLT